MNLPEHFSLVNAARAFSTDGFNIPQPHDLYLACAICEEAGEVAGVIKKMRRGFNGREAKKMLKIVRKEWEETCHKHGEDMGDIQYPAYSMQQLEERWKVYMREKLADELADLYIYMDLLTTCAKINLPKAIIDKFNLATKEMGFDETQFSLVDLPAPKEENNNY